jgi:hypothetical protein
MRRLPIVGLLLVLTGRSAAEPVPTIEALRQAVLKSPNGVYLGRAYMALFLRVGRAGLPELTKDADPGIALQAAWEVHKKAVKRPKHISGRSDDIYDPNELAKFTTFLETRAKIKPPDWWSGSFRDVDLFPGSHCHLRAIGRPTETVGLVAGQLFVRADCPDSGTSYDLEAYDLKTGKRVWKEEVCATDDPFSSGIPYHRVELREKDGCLYVFGAGGGVYLEAFELATGHCWFRFCTSYWNHPSELWGLK